MASNSAFAPTLLSRKEESQPALIKAVQGKKLREVKQILSKMKEVFDLVEVRDRDGRTVYHYAMACKDDEIVTMLMEKPVELHSILEHTKLQLKQNLRFLLLILLGTKLLQK